MDALSPLKRENLSPEQDNNREYRTELNNHLEHAVKRFRHIQLYKLIEQNHVSGTADRQPLGDALYNAKQKGFEQFYHRVFLLKIFVQFFMLFYTLPQLMPSRKQTSGNVIKKLYFAAG